MTTIRAKMIGDRETAEALRDAGKEINYIAHTLVVRAGQSLQARVKAGASGRPGPNVITGDYRRSIRRKSYRYKTATIVEVGTDAVQGRRLELGFWNMRDSLGRLYHQPPYPHFGPAFDATAPKLEQSLNALVNRVLGR